MRSDSIDEGGGSRNQFEWFAARAGPALLRSAYLLTGDLGHAEDLLQATLLRVARRWHVIDRSPDAYAREVLVNLSRDRHRRLARRVPEVLHADPPAGSDDRMARLLERHEVTKAVRSLPRRQREVIVLRFFLDLSVAQTAGALRLSEGTVKSHTARALERLRELLEESSNPKSLPTEVRHAH